MSKDKQITKFLKGSYDEYLDRSDWRVKENSNSFFSFGGMNKYVTGKTSALYWKSFYDIFNKEIMRGHDKGDYHIHDLGGLAPYCFGASLNDLLKKGIQGVPNVSRSAPATRLRAITSQIANIMTIFQNETMGAIAFSSWNVYLAPFLYFDKLRRDKKLAKITGEDNDYGGKDPYREKIELDYNELDIEDITESIQNMVYALNSNSRAGAEPAFTNLTLDFKVLKPMQKKNVLIKGKEVDGFKYKDFQKEVDMLTDIFSKVMYEGDRDDNSFAYPIPTFNISKDMEWDNPYYKYVWKMSAKYGVPYFGNFIAGDLDEEDVYSMCPMTPDTEVLVKSDQNGVRVAPINDIVGNMNTKETKYDVWTPEGWSKAKPVKTPKTDVYEVTLSNGVSVKLGKNHLQPTKDNGTLKAEELTMDMWLPFNAKPYENEDIGSYDLGYAIGAYAGDGSYDGKALIYSLDAAKKDEKTEKNIRKLWESYGFSVKTTFPTNKNIRSVRVNGNPRDIVETYVEGTNALEKGFTRKAFNSSIDFREGIIAGFRDTDGARDRKRLYTSSNKLRHDFQKLFTGLGRKAMINYKDNRKNRYSGGKNTNYRIDYPGRKNYGDLYKFKNNMNYHKITKIEKVNYSGDNLYCFEVDNEEHLFMLANGLVTHNCRLRLDRRELMNKTGGLFGAAEKTGSIGVFTLNLPIIGYKAKEHTKVFLFNEIERQMETGKSQLMLKKQLLNKLLKKGLYPALSEYLGNFDTLFMTIGLVGANEMCQNFLGEDKDISSKEGRELAKEVLDFMKEKLADFQEETGELFNLEATPAESTAYRLAKKSLKRFPDLITAGDEDPYFTNSVHLPVGADLTYNEIYNHQDGLLSEFTGGSVYHNYLKNSLSELAVKDQVKTIFENWDIPYLSNSPLYSICKTHGYLEGQHNVCPKCGENTDTYQRVTGYIRRVDNFNKGKAQEFKDRNQKELDLT